MAITQASSLPQQYVSDLGQDYGQQLAGLTSVPLDTSRFAPQVAAQDQFLHTCLRTNNKLLTQHYQNLTNKLP